MTATGALAQSGQARVAGLVSMDGRAYPLKSASIEAQAEGGIAATKLIQTYENPYQEPLEVFYTLPLPADGTVVGYTVRLGTRVIRGEIRKREEARNEYRKALLEGRTAALLEQDRADTFTQQLGSLPPGQSAEIEFEVLQPLIFLPSGDDRSAEWEYRFPTVVGVRYEGAPDRVPDAEKLDVDRTDSEIPVRLSATLRIADGSVVEIRPHAPGHNLELEESGSGVRATLRQGMRLDRDLVIRWSAVRQEVGVRVVEGKGLPCDNGHYLLVTVTPPAIPAAALNRDLTLLIDASGSMSGKPLDQAKAVASHLLRSLCPEDTFEVLVFANRPTRLHPAPVRGSEANISKALGLLRKVRASGGTEMADALGEALKPLRPDSQRQVVLLSDGYIGFEPEVIGRVMKRMAPGARVHAVGIGSAPNRSLIRGVARAGRGSEILVSEGDDAGIAAKRLLQATVHPVLTNIEVRGSNLAGIAPARPQDVLEGKPLILLAEVGEAAGEMEIRGHLAGKTAPWVRRVDLRAGVKATALPIGALFGRMEIEDLELQAAAQGDYDKVGVQIERAGLRHGITSSRTSLIAVSEDQTVNPRDPRRREHLPVEIPAGISAEGVGLERQSMAPLSSVFGFAEDAAPSFSRLGIHLKKQSESVLDRLVSPPRRLTPPENRVSRARVLHLESRLLVLEFEVPSDGLVLPPESVPVHVHFEDGETREARIVADAGSDCGPHRAGMTVRLALALPAPHTWKLGHVQVIWHGVYSKHGAEIPVEMHLFVTLGN